MITIRTASKSEVKVLQDLNDKVFIDNQQYDPDLDMNWARSTHGKKYFTELLNNPDACCLIAEDNGKKIGYIASRQKIVSYRKSKYLEIENIGVVPEYQSKGVGTMLMKACLEWGRTRGFQKAFVNAYFGNTKAITFYKRAGFEEIDVSLEKRL